MCQVQLVVSVGLHHQRNVCCKTWHKKPGTEVCIACHTLYQQWTDESWCVAPACCLHTVVLGIVCDSRVITETFAFNPHLYTLWRIYLTALPHHITWYDTCQCIVGHRMSCGSEVQYHSISWTVVCVVCVCVCVCLCALFKYVVMSVSVLKKLVTWLTPTW